MSTKTRIHAAWVALLCSLAFAGGARATELDESLASLRKSVAHRPNDWQLSWSLAQALEAAGRPGEAADHIVRHMKRWPDRPPEGWLALGRCAYRAGRVDEAVPALERAIATNPGDAEALLYLGLSRQQQGLRQSAEAHFEAAARQDPRYTGESLLLSGMSHLARGDRSGGRDRLEQVLEHAPLSASAREARRVLDESPLLRSDFEIKASAGALYDSNVTLESEGDVPGAGSANADARFDFGSQLTWRPMFAERRPIQLTAAYGRSDYAELSKYSSQSFAASAAGLLPLGARAALRLDGGVGYSLLDNDPYLLSAGLRPSLIVAVGSRSGVLRILANGERLQYDEGPQFDSLERSGWLVGAGAEHLLPLGHESQTWIAWGGSYQHRFTEADRDVFGLHGAYDGDRYRVLLRGGAPLFFGVGARAELAFDAERYDNRNVIDTTHDLTSPKRRRDFVWSPRLALRRPLYRGVDLEVHASYTDRASNIDLYGYARALAGVRLHATLP